MVTIYQIVTNIIVAIKYFSVKTSTFRDLNLQLGPRSQTKKRDMTKSGFNKITPEEHDRRGGSAYRRALHDLCCDIFESAGLEVRIIWDALYFLPKILGYIFNIQKRSYENYKAKMLGRPYKYIVCSSHRRIRSKGTNFSPL